MRQVQCITCKKLADLTLTPKHASVGFGRCPGDPSGAFVSLTFVRDCKRYVAKWPDAPDKAEAWRRRAEENNSQRKREIT